MSVPFIGEYKDARGRTPVDPNIFKQPHSAVIGFSGQSMLGNFGQLTPYNPTSGQVYEFDIQTGNIYQVTDGSFQTMGMDGWAGRLSVLPYWADTLVHEGKAQRVLIAAHNIGGSCAARWCPIGDLYIRSSETLRMLKLLGIPPNLWVEVLGQADVDVNTTGACASAQNFADYMRWKWTGLRNDGLTCPIVMGQGAHWTNVSNVQTARYAMVKQGQILAIQALAGTALGPDDDEFPDAGYRVDGVHPIDNMRYFQLQRWLPAFPVF
jgi:hypothetical protein